MFSLTIISAGILLLLNTGQYVLPVKHSIYIVKFDTKSGSSYVLPVKHCIYIVKFDT